MSDTRSGFSSLDDGASRPASRAGVILTAPSRSGFLGVLVLTWVLVTAATAMGGKVKPALGEPPPSVTWTSVSGESLTWDGLREGGPLVVVYWATWCAVCREDWPGLKKLAEKYADAPTPPAWAAVSLGEKPKRVAKVAGERKLPGHIIADPDEENGDTLGIEFVPTVWVLDADGRVAYMGGPKLRDLDRVLKKLTAVHSAKKDQL